ncbi:L domain-like protein [Neocallimastix lanati (nom. inval.)]|uniref:L domain-like protein n=1 Tax=Neocallimastix californiae TaxID=1754190 RepID=A0A1Y2AEE6_9FUNG|nr:L domain-like protein [Neocallimastix sp. JGI-2020a]ORY20921.1 L domain-like protein [Neocallimastix californiae]|eukprot:ORY20921.1 L domain-like protein [Neocallimastix californiae]
MKYQFFVGLALSALYGLVLADNQYTGDCKEIYNYLKGLGYIEDEKSYTPDLRSCEVDNNGNVVSLDIFSYCLKEEDFDKILSYQSIKSLHFDTNDSYHSSSYDELRSCGNMKSLPQALFKLNNLQTLNLYGYDEFKENEISSLPKSLTSLSFGNVELQQFSINELSECTNLKTLELYRTLFSKNVDFTPLKKLNNVTKIKLSNSHGSETVKEYLDSLFITYFENLNSLTFSYCGFDEKVTIEKISNLKNLEKLHILGTTDHCIDDVNLFSSYYCPLTVIPNSIFSLSGLKEFDLHGNSISIIPSSIGDLNKLINLNLNNCAIKSLPDSISNLKSLKAIKMSENKLSTIPQVLSKISSLEEINLSYNEIDDEIPESLNDLPNLKRFEIQGNVNIKGKTLTNKSLKYCSYLDYDDYNSKTTSLCKAKDIDCFQYYDDKIGNCAEEASTTTTKKTTTKKTTKKTTTKKTTTKKTTKKTTTKKTTTKKTTKKTKTKKTTTKKTTKKTTTKKTSTRKTTKNNHILFNNSNN